MKLYFLVSVLLCYSCSSMNEQDFIKLGENSYKIISNGTVIKNQDKVDAVVYWHQRTDDAFIRVTHNNERKNAKFFIPNLAKGLSKLIKKRRRLIIMVLDEDMMQHSRTKTILASLSSITKVYISYFPKGTTKQ